MSDTKIFGIKNCDTMKKAFAWLDNHGVEYEFHNYKKHGVDEGILEQAIDQHGWEKQIVYTKYNSSGEVIYEQMKSIHE